MAKCKECNGQLTLMSSSSLFFPDEEPYKSGERVKLDLEVEEYVHANFCQNCDRIVQIWIDTLIEVTK